MCICISKPSRRNFLRNDERQAWGKRNILKTSLNCVYENKTRYYTLDFGKNVLSYKLHDETTTIIHNSYLRTIARI